MNKKIIEKVKNFFGIGRYSDYINDYFDKSNIRSSLYVSTVVMVLELLMIISTLFRQFNEETKRTTDWVVIHLSCFTVLFVAADFFYSDSFGFAELFAA